MMKLGLTGSIGMGKSTTAALFEQAGVPVFDADKAVHRLYAENKATIKAIASRFPTALVDGKISRTVLSDLILADKTVLPDLEKIVHPAVAQSRRNWLKTQKKAGAPMVLLDIPLLFETGGQALVDKIIVVSAPFDVQKERVLARPNMTEERFMHILQQQMPDQKKRKHADFIVDTSKGFENAAKQVQTIIQQLKEFSDQKL